MRITVRDTGPGIEPRHMQRIFDPFFTTKEVGKGTGMGLAVAHGIVKDHGGSITAYSRPGKGATFYVLIPQISGEIVEKTEALPEIPRGGGTVLLIDDEEMLVDLGTTILQSLGYSVVSSTSSPEALKTFTADPQSFDAVITDFTMPYLTGYELAQEFLRIRADIPIILCTGFSSQISEEQAQAAGIRAFVMKPYNMREIAAVLQSGSGKSTINRIILDSDGFCAEDARVTDGHKQFSGERPCAEHLPSRFRRRMITFWKIPVRPWRQWAQRLTGMKKPAPFQAGVLRGIIRWMAIR